MSGCCGCCAALKPRYKRLVDNIFPANPQDGLVKSNMDKLTFFALKSPEKLDRIGEYLAHRLSRDVSRHKIQFVFIAMEALDQLLVACHAQSLNLFVESFLKMVQKLLECDEPDLQILATTSFVKFANIEEDTPSYHRRYDFFVSKFSSMCHNNQSNSETRNRLRVAGLHGLQGVVRKTVSDDLQVNIWEQTHMEKIVPSLLYNMQNTSGLQTDPESPRDEEHPAFVAETVFRDLVCRASFGNISSVLKPVLVHLDDHKLWVPNEFAAKCFKIIMYSVQAQYGYMVVQMIMNHLDKHSKNEPRVKASIVEVLSDTVLIAAGGSIGPSVLDVFNSLLRHLRVSVETRTDDRGKQGDEKRFQEAVINTIGEFANNLPDYQKIEIMMFVMGKVPLPSDDEDVNNSKDVKLQTMLMKTLLKVGTKYRTVLMQNAFPSAFLEPLIRMSLVSDAGIRLIVQEILHTLIDRHDNLKKLNKVHIPKDISELNLTVEKAPRQDVMFMKKNGSLFYWQIFENMQKANNRVDNFEALFCTLGLLCIEMGGDEILVELFRLALGIQHMACDSGTNLPMTHKCAIHAVIAAYLNLISQLTAIPSLCQHVSQVIAAREKNAPHLLPERAFNRSNTADSYPNNDTPNASCLFDVGIIKEALESSGHDASRLTTPYIAKPTGIGLDFDQLEEDYLRSDPFYVTDAARSTSDLHSMSIDLESAASTPGVTRKQPEEEITFESLKKLLVENDPEAKQKEEEKRLQILESFRSGPFEEIMARSEAKSQQFHNKLNEILDMIATPADNNEKNNSDSAHEQETTPVFEMQFPDLFVY